MRRTKRTDLITTLATIFLTAGTALAAPPPATSLNKCQNAVKVEGTKFIQGYLKAAGACLQRVSTDVVQKNLGTPSTAAANTCAAQYRKISDTRALGKSLVEKLQAKILAKCAPGGNNTHTLQDILGTGATVPQPLDAENLGAYCTGAGYGGDGAINTLQEWIGCIAAVHTCAARSALAAQYPRLLDYLPLVQPVMSGLTPPPADPTKISDAIAGLNADDTAIEGGNNDGQPELFCGPGILSSGDAVAAEVLSGKTFSNGSAAGLTGTMPNNGAVNITPSTSAQTIAAGYHNGSGSVAGDADLISTNIRFGANIFGVSGSVIQATGNAGLGDVLAGKTFSNIGGSGMGTMPNNGAVTLTPTTSNQSIAAGYHNGAGVCEGDADLVSGNIKAGVDLFGVSGDPDVVDTSSGDAVASDIALGKKAWVDGAEVTGTKLPAPLLKTAQTTAYGTGSDGDLQKGVARSYTDNGDGTVTDEQTGLMWEKKSDDGSIHDKDNYYTWGMSSPPYTMNGTMVTTFLDQLNNRCKNDETISCSVDADCSVPGGPCGFAGYRDWRMPNVIELQSIVSYEAFNPSVSSAFHTGCVPACTVTICSCTLSGHYWSSSTLTAGPGNAWAVIFNDGDVVNLSKLFGTYVRAVRGGS